MSTRAQSPAGEKDSASIKHDEHLHTRHSGTHEFHNHVEDYGGGRGFWGNVRWQLDTWHAGRGDRGFAASIIPWPTRTLQNDNLPKNPFKLLGRLSLLAWASFFCGWLCWMCDGYV